MITVLASIGVLPEYRDQFIDMFNSNINHVRSEEGCIEYYLTIDVSSGIDIQKEAENELTVIEKWQNLDALHTHLNAPHMLRFQEKVQNMVTAISLKVLQNTST